MSESVSNSKSSHSSQRSSTMSGKGSTSKASSTKDTGGSSSSKKKGTPKKNRIYSPPKVSAIKHIIAVRDEWARSVGDDSVLTKGVTEFYRFVINLLKNKRLNEHPKTNAYLELYLRARPNLYDENEEDVREIIQTQVQRRLYRIPCLIHTNKPDKRFGNIFNCVLEELYNMGDFSIYPLLTRFYTDEKKAKIPQEYLTILAKPLEKMLGLALLLEHSALKKKNIKTTATPSKAFEKFMKKRKTTDEEEGRETLRLIDPVVMPAFTDREEMAQKAGKVIQQVNHAWTALAESLHYSSLEQMVWPYIRIESNPFRFNVLKKREDGYMPLTSATNLEFDCKGVTVASQTFAGVTEFNDTCDAYLRLLSFHFLNDVRKVFYINRIYLDDSITLRNRMAPFRVERDSLPKRFNEFDTARLDEIRKARMVLLNIGITEVNDDAEDSNSDSIEEDGVAHADFQETAPPYIPAVPQALYNKKCGLLKRAKAMHGLTNVPRLSDVKVELLEAIEQYFVLKRGSFREIETLVAKTNFPDSVHGRTQFVCIDPPYNVRRVANMPNSEYDVLKEQDIEDTVKQIDLLLRPGGHAVIFTTFQDLENWRARILNYERRQNAPGLNIGTGKTFTVDKTPYVFVNAFNNHKNNPARSSCSLQNMCEVAVHLMKNGNKKEEDFQMVNYSNHGFVPSQMSGFKNVIDNIPRIPAGELLTVKRVDLEKSIGRPLNTKELSEDDSKKENTTWVQLRTEQKPVCLLKELICRYTNPGDLVVDLYGGTFAAALACLQLPQHRKFVGTELDKFCHEKAEDRFVDVFAKFISNPTTITDLEFDDDELLAAARWSLKETRKVNIADPAWTCPDGLQPFQRMPNHIMMLMANKQPKPSTILNYGQITYDRWPNAIKQLLNSIDKDMALQMECAVFNVSIAPTEIRHPNAGSGVFAAKSFNQGDLICYYYGTCVYSDLTNKKDLTARYGGTGMLSVDVKRFKKCAMEVSTTGNEFDACRHFSGERGVFIVPPEFCIGSYINDWHYIEGDADKAAFEKDKLLAKRRYQNAEVRADQHPLRNKSLITNPDFLKVYAKEDISTGQEIYIDYGKSFRM